MANGERKASGQIVLVIERRGLRVEDKPIADLVVR